MKLAVVGSRSINDYELIKEKLDEIENINMIISGGAAGVDSLAKRYSEENRIDLAIFPPDWNTYGRSAGYERNKEIVQFADRVIAFWDGESRGTTHSFKLAKEYGKPIEIIKVIS